MDAGMSKYASAHIPGHPPRIWLGPPRRHGIKFCYMNQSLRLPRLVLQLNDLLYRGKYRVKNAKRCTERGIGAWIFLSANSSEPLRLKFHLVI